MNKCVLTLTITAALLSALPSETMFGSQDPKARIKEASSVFLNAADASITKAKILNALLELLDITVSLNQETQYGAEIKYRIDVAKDIFQKNSIFDDKARQYLSFAYRMMTNGKRYEKPKELDEFVTPAEAQEKARKYAKKLVDEALTRLEEGNKGETAKLLLELVLMIVTPISG
jgi:hypothetical protein